MGVRAAPAWIALALLAGCAGTIPLNAQWTDPAFQAASLHRVIVLGADRDRGRTAALEDAFRDALGTRTTEYVAGHARLAAEPADSAALRTLEAGAEGILVARWVDARLLQKEYAPVATYLAVPQDYASGWVSYYTGAVAYAAAAPPAADGAPLRLEANLYRVDGGRLVWSALSGPIREHAPSWRDDMQSCVESLAKSLRPRSRKGRA